MDAVFQFDRGILLWVQDNLRSGALTPVMTVITHLADKGAFWIALTLVLLVVRKTRRLGTRCALAMMIGLIITNLIVKNWVARVRPYELIENLKLLVGRADDFSFPSGHTTNSFSCAWVLFKKAPRKWGVPALVLAILISLSRIYVGIHYPTDVLAGVVIGIGSASLALWLARKIERKWFRRLAKKFYRL